MRLQCAELGIELIDEVGVVPFDNRANTLIGDSSALKVALEVVEIGMRPDLLLTGDLAGRDLVEQRDGPIADGVDCERILRVV